MGLLKLLLKGSWLLLRLFWWMSRHFFRLCTKARSGRVRSVHGSARFSSALELLWQGVLLGNGPVVGATALGKLVRFTRDGLVMVFAATGAGKGLGVVIPTLLDYPGSIFVTDPKGENYAITHHHRRRRGTVRVLNPADLANSERFNPLDMIRKDTALETDDATALAKLLVRPDAREPHWDDKAVSLLTALILHVLHEPTETKTLAYVRALSVGAPETFCETLKDISRSSRSLHAAEIATGFLTQASNAAGDATPEFKSILSNVHKSTEQWSAGSPAGQLSSYSTFTFDELIDGVTTIYVCIDEDLLGAYERWLRVMTGCALNALTRGKSRPKPRHKALLLLDEVAVLGPLEPLERQSGLLRAYCTPVLIWQNLPQVSAVYGTRAAAFLANASCRVFFGVNDNDTATYVASMLGQTTSFSQSLGVSQASDAWLRHNQQEGMAESGYWLLDPAEIQRLPTTKLIVKFRDLPFPALLARIDYRKRPAWLGRWKSWTCLSAGALRGRAPADDPKPSTAAAASHPQLVAVPEHLPFRLAERPSVHRPA